MSLEDTYFDNDVTLSNECAIVIDEKTFNKISSVPIYTKDLSKFKIYVYKGNQQNAVSLALNDMGYDAFMISSHGYVNGIEENSPSAKMYDFVNDFAQKNNIPQERHFYSKLNYEDALARNEKSEEINKMHLMHVLDNSSVLPEISEQIKLLLEYRQDITSLLKRVIEQIGFEQLKTLTGEFNKNYIETLKEGKNSKTF